MRPKRKQNDDDDDVGNSASELDASQIVKPKSTTSKGKAKTTKKPKYSVSGEESSPIQESEQQAVKIFKNAEGEKYIDLGKKRHASVRPFKGQVFLDVREFFGADGAEKPSKKGISLTNEQWEVLKRSAKTIDSWFADHGKK